MTTNMRGTLQVSHVCCSFGTRCDSPRTTMMELPNIARKKKSSN
jgi:hypothetical protein